MISIDKKKRKDLLLYALLAIITLLWLIPFFSVGFTCGDDFQYFLTTRRGPSWWWEDALYHAHQGRFYFLLTKYFYNIPYLIDDFGYTKVVQYITLVASYGMFAYLVAQLFKSRPAGMLVYLLLVFDTALTPNNHTPTIAYPFFFTFSAIVFMFALYIHLRYIERGGSWRLWLSAAVFFIAYLFYETYLIFALIFGLLLLIRHCRHQGLKTALRSREFWREVLPYITTAIIYLTLYIGYRQWLMHNGYAEMIYGGTSISSGNITASGFFRVLWRCTRGVLPGTSYFLNRGLIADNSELLSGHSNNLLRVITHSSLHSWICSILMTTAVWLLTRRSKIGTNIKTKHLVAGIFLGILIAFSSHTLIGLAEKYNNGWSLWMNGYVTSYFSIFGLMLTLACLIILSINAINSNHIHRIIRIIWCLSIALFAMLICYSNEHIGHEWGKSQHRMRLIDMIAKHHYFDTLPDDAVLYINELYTLSDVSSSICLGTPYLEQYIDMRAHRHFNYASTPEALAELPEDAPLYYLHACETRKAGELLITISPVNIPHSADSLTCQTSDIFYMSPTKEYMVFYRTDSTWRSQTFLTEDKRQRATHLTLSGKNIDPASIVISNMMIDY